MEGARIFDSASYYLYGTEARLNFPHEMPQPLSDEFKAKIDAAAQESNENEPENFDTEDEDEDE